VKRAIATCALAAAAFMLFLAPGANATADHISVCSYDGTRSRAPLTTGAGGLSHATLRMALLDPTNFGPSGIVPLPVVLEPAVATASAATLAGCDVFFTSVFTGATAAEAAAIRTAVNSGMVLITDADAPRAEQASVNTILSAFGGGRSVGPGIECPGSATGGAVTSTGTPVTNGAFGDIRGGSVATTATASATPASADVSLVTCTGSVRYEIPRGALAPASGLVMVGGDPSAFDIFTNSGSAPYNANNLTAYLNAFAAAVFQPTSKNDCKKGGWAVFRHPSFRNQGQCIKFVNHQGSKVGKGKREDHGHGKKKDEKKGGKKK
jgi:hypothetical protein